MNEEAAAQDYLLAYLQADPALAAMINGVFTRMTPTDVPFPVVKIDVLDRSDLMVVGLYRIWSDMTVLVRGIVGNAVHGEEDWSEVRAIADRIDALLHDHEDNTSDIRMSSFREESYTNETFEGGKLFLHAGGTYRLRASEP